MSENKYFKRTGLEAVAVEAHPATSALLTGRQGWLRGLGGFVGVFAIAYALVYVAWTQFHWGGEENASLIADLANIPIALLATAAALRVALDGRHSANLRRAWFVLGLALGVNALAEGLWFYVNSVLQVDAFPSIADPFYLAFYPLVLIGLVIFPNAPLSREARTKFWLDLAVVSTVAGMYVWNFILAPTWAGAENDLLSLGLAAAYLVADLMLITGVTILIFRRVDAATRGALLIFSLGLIFFTTADLFFAYTSLFSEFASGSLGDAGYVVSYALFGLAGLRQAFSGGGVDFQRERWLDRLATILPFATILLGYGLVLFVYSSSPELNNQLWGILFGAILLALLITARQVVAVRENEMLNSRLRASADELSALSEDLEKRVADRTRDLTLAAEVGRTLTQVQAIEALLANAVEAIRARFDLYYTQIYLVDPARRTLILRAGTGPVGAELLRRAHRLPIDSGSINGRAAAEKRAVIVADTAMSASFRPNPLLPQTRSEMSAPLIVGDEVVGVLDLQDDQPGALSADHLPAFEALAGQLAIAVQNARLLAEAEQARAEVEAQARRLSQAGWADFLNAVERSERIGYVFDASGLLPIQETATPPPDQPTLAVPITVSGNSIGAIQLDGSRDQSWTDDEVQVVNAIAGRVALQVENLRLLAQAESYRLGAEKAARQLTREGWQDYLEKIEETDDGYAYDHDKVRSLDKVDAASVDEAVFTQALSVRGETIGELAIAGLCEKDVETADLVTAVAEQLSARIENLRLADQTRQALAYLTQRERAVSAVADTAVELLQRGPAAVPEVLARVGSVSEVSRAYIFENFIDSDGLFCIRQTHEWVAEGIAPHLNNPELQHLPYATSLPRWQTTLGRGEIIRGPVRNFPAAEREILEPQNIRAILVIPMFAGKEFYGFIGFDDCAHERAWGAYEVNLLQTISVSIMNAVVSARLFNQAQEALAETQHRNEELATINRVVEVAASSFNLPSILQAAAKEIVEVLKARNSGIALLDEKRQTLNVAADHNTSPDDPSSVGVSIPLANNPSSTRVIETKRSLVIPSAQTDPLTEPIHDLLRERRTECLMIVPLLARGEVIGTIGVDTTDPARVFTSAETALVETIAGQLAGVIENVRLFEEAEHNAAELKALFAAMTDVVLVYDKDGRYVRIAPTNPALLYKLPEDMIGKTVYEVLPRPKADELLAYIRQALETRQSVEAEYELNIGGIDLWFSANISPLGEDTVFWVARDITERKRAENALAKRAVELETVARVSTAASTILDGDKLLQDIVDLTKASFGLYHAHIYLTNEAGTMLNLAAGAGEVGRQMVAQGWQIPVEQSRATGLLRPHKSLVARAARERQGIIVNNVREAPDFLPNPLLPQTRSEMAVPLIAGAKVLGVFDVQSEVVDRFTDEDLRIQTTLAGQLAVALQNARLYAEQSATVARLRELDQLKSSFLANMSHELRTPLNSILGFAEVLLEGIDGDLTDRMDNDLRVIHKNGQHLLTLINDILDMAKIEAGKMSLTIEPFNLQEVLEEVVELARPLAQNKSLELRLETQVTDQFDLEADRIRLRQVMINLVNNAIKFTEAGSVSINAVKSKSRVLVAIRDTGVGIPVNHLETIFHEFHQVDSSTTRKAGGTGLGLPISRHLIELHKGRLWAESAGLSGPDGGSTFYVELPIHSEYHP